MGALHVVCVRVGEKYPREYVAILHNMVARNLKADFHFWCMTDDERPIHPEIGMIPALPDLPGWWAKLALFCDAMPWEEGDRIVYFDLDVAIVGRLEDLVETKGIIRDWHLPGYNSSVMVWDHGEHREVWDLLTPEVMQTLHGDQDWITSLDLPPGGTMVGDEAHAPKWDLLPRDWCVSYRSHATDWPPAGTKVVCFHGEPKPHQCDGWVSEVWKLGGLAEFPNPSHMNVTMDFALSNVRRNIERDLEWFVGAMPHKGTAVIVGGAPSLKASIPAIKDHRRRGAKIIALNNAAGYLNSHGIIPDTLFICDARPENGIFVRAQAGRVVLASQCAPEVFDEALERGHDVHLVNLAICDEMRDILAPYDQTKPVVLIGGGSTVGLRAINLVILCGYKKLHIYGMDSSFSASEHHAYEQDLNAHDQGVAVRVPATGKEYVCAPWMARQAAEFRDIAWPALMRNEVKTWVHGWGLIPDLAKAMSDALEDA